MGYSIPQILEILGCNQQSIHNWFNAFEQEGFRGLYEKPRKGRPVIATVDYRNRPVQIIKTNPRDTKECAGAVFADVVFKCLRDDKVQWVAKHLMRKLDDLLEEPPELSFIQLDRDCNNRRSGPERRREEREMNRPASCKRFIGKGKPLRPKWPGLPNGCSLPTEEQCQFRKQFDSQLSIETLGRPGDFLAVGAKPPKGL
jgi:hypothetical protein